MISDFNLSKYVYNYYKGLIFLQYLLPHRIKMTKNFGSPLLHKFI